MSWACYVMQDIRNLERWLRLEWNEYGYEILARDSFMLGKVPLLPATTQPHLESNACGGDLGFGPQRRIHD